MQQVMQRERGTCICITNKYLHCTLGGFSLFYKNCGNLLTFLDYMYSMFKKSPTTNYLHVNKMQIFAVDNKIGNDLHQKFGH